jgi:hypothetical protein
MKVDEPSFDYLLEDNLFLNETLSEFILPIVNYGTVTVDSYGRSPSLVDLPFVTLG